MGMYINPTNISKEQWLEDNATPIEGMHLKEYQPDTNKHGFQIVLINNGAFTAAGVMYSAQEYEYWDEHLKSGADGRGYKLFRASADSLRQLPGLQSL